MSDDSAITTRRFTATLPSSRTLPWQLPSVAPSNLSFQRIELCRLRLPSTVPQLSNATPYKSTPPISTTLQVRPLTATLRVRTISTTYGQISKLKLYHVVSTHTHLSNEPRICHLSIYAPPRSSLSDAMPSILSNPPTKAS